MPLGTPVFIGSGSATLSTPPFIRPRCLPLLPAFVPTSASSGPGGGGAFFPTSALAGEEQLSVWGRVIPCASPLIHIRWPQEFVGCRVRVFKNMAEILSQPLMGFSITSRTTPVSGMYADDFAFSFPSQVAGILVVGDASDTSFEAFQLTWRRPASAPGCGLPPLQEFSFVRASRRIVTSDDGCPQAGDAAKLRIDTTLCEPAGADDPWPWAVVSAVYEDDPAVPNEPTAAEEALLEALLAAASN